MIEAEPPPRSGFQARFLRFYDRALHVSRTGWALPILCLVCLVDSAFLPVPPDVVLIAVTLARRDRWLWNALCALVFSILGGICGWIIGHFFWQWAGPWLLAHIPGFTAARFTRVENLFQTHAFFPFVAATVLGIPYCLFTLAGGICGVPIPMLIAGMAAGRGTRFFLVALTIRIFGERARIFLERHFKKVSFGLAAASLLILGLRIWLLSR